MVCLKLHPTIETFDCKGVIAAISRRLFHNLDACINFREDPVLLYCIIVNYESIKY